MANSSSRTRSGGQPTGTILLYVYSGIRIIDVWARGRWLLPERRREDAAKREHGYRGAHYPIFLRDIKYSTRGTPRAAAGTAVGPRHNPRGGWTSTGIMGNNGEKPEGLYQWELAAVRPSNGRGRPRRRWTMHQKSRWSVRAAALLPPLASFAAGLAVSFCLFSLSLLSVLLSMFQRLFLFRWSASMSLQCTCSCLRKVQTPPQLPSLTCATSLSMTPSVRISSSFFLPVVFLLSFRSLFLSLFLPNWPADGRPRFYGGYNTGAFGYLAALNASFSQHSLGHSASATTRFRIWYKRNSIPPSYPGFYDAFAMNFKFMNKMSLSELHIEHLAFIPESNIMCSKHFQKIKFLTNICMYK